MRRRSLAFDALIAVTLGSVALFVLATLSSRLPGALYTPDGNDAWFQADLSRALRNMVDASSNHYRTKVHPIASITIHPLVAGLRALWPGSDLQAAMRVVWGCGLLWVAGFYALCRLLGSGRIAAACFSALAIGSAGFQFWFSVPETYAFGSLSLLLVLLTAALAVHRPVSDRLLTIASAASLSITVTNWIAGLALAISQRPWRRAVRISAIAFAMVAVLAVVQRSYYSFAKLFFLGSSEELDYVNLSRAGSLFDKLAAIFWSPVSVPGVLTQLQPAPGLNFLTVQLSTPASGSWAGAIALALWSLLLLAGVWGLASASRWRGFAMVLGLTLGIHALMHFFYGEETFLYAAHFLPMLLALAVFAQRSPLGRLAPALALAAAGFAAVNNTAVFAAAARQLVQRAPAALSAASELHAF
ncbi:hypothetical protein [Variovorax fucosicus]|uniref:hypothetical protein n=1 Tax=Variovorax fucosicus TaxID=3053517 RepID=UPI0025771A84|nr:hypothetical protein [Variovorax sp. J22G47]MDM0054880.1 hypothetical protein [Variovorax sp. J22G47]